jgi:L-amino acid N-acyltransferase YncA
MGHPVTEIRRLGQRDTALYRAIRLECLRRHPQAFGASFDQENAETLDWFARRLRENAIFGAFHAKELLGIASFHSQPTRKKRHKGVLWGMYVRPAERGAGIADLLIESVCAYARGQRVEQLHLTVVGGNAPAHQLYRRLGFVEYGLEPRSHKEGDRYYDEILMVKFL